MKALILAAGMGTRLKPLTYVKPKSMVEVNGKPILFKQIDNLLENGIKEIIVIAGYKAEMIINAINKSYDNIKIIINKDYDKTNNMYSAYLAMEYMYNNEFLLMNADVFFDTEVLRELLKRDYINSIVVEEGTYNDESMKVVCEDGRIIEISKKISEEKSFGVSIDVYKFSKEGSKIFYDKIKEYIEDKKDLSQWTEVALNEILFRVEFRPCPLKGRWIEIDTHDDLRIAESIFLEQK